MTLKYTSFHTRSPTLFSSMKSPHESDMPQLQQPVTVLNFPTKPWKYWLKLCRIYNNSVQLLFARLGRLAAKHPVVVICLCCLIVGAFASGFAFMKSENRIEKLYIPQDSVSITNLKNARSYGFYRPSRLTEVILLNKKGSNVLTKECFEDALRLHKIITNITGYSKLCLPISHDPTVASTGCITIEPLAISNYNDDFNNLLSKLNDPKNANKILYEKVFGKIARDSSGRIISAEALRLIYVLRGPEFGQDVSNNITDWEKMFLERLRSFISLQCGPLYFTTGRSIDDAISESIGSDVKLMAITFVVMIGFACLMLGKYRNPVSGHALLAVSGVLAVALGIGAAFGLAMFSGVPFVSIIGVLPFLIVGVGIDDMFIIVDELDRTSADQPITARLSTVMRHVGPAITMTTMTDLLAFAVGTSSKFPSIVYFCAYAALAISFAFILLVTLFIAFMSFDCRRMNAGRRDVLACIKALGPTLIQQTRDEGLPHTSNKIMGSYARILVKPCSRVTVVILSIGLLATGIYGTTFINEEFERRNLAKDGSEYVQFLDTFEEYFTEGIQVDLVLESGIDYSDPLTLNKIGNLTTIIKENQHYEPGITSWLLEFQKWSKKNGVLTLSTNFIPSLKQFLQSHPRFLSDILFYPNNSDIEASRFRCFIKQTKSSAFLRDAMTTLREDLAEESDLPIFASSYQFIFIEQFVSTLPETIRNLGLASVAIFLITAFFLVNPFVVFIVLLGFISLIFELLGLMHIWGVSLNSISMINLVMAIGFAVDYSAHIAHAFVYSSHVRPEDKAIDALSTVGASVLMGGFSTFLGMVVTAFASSEIFRIFFKMFFGIVVLGLIHGLCFLPVWLSILCCQDVDTERTTSIIVVNQQATTDV